MSKTTIGLRLEEGDLEVINARAKSHGLTRSEWLRQRGMTDGSYVKIKDGGTRSAATPAVDRGPTGTTPATGVSTTPAVRNPYLEFRPVPKPGKKEPNPHSRLGRR